MRSYMTRRPMEAQRWDYVHLYDAVEWDLEDIYGRWVAYRETLVIGVRFDGDELVVGDLMSITDRGDYTSLNTEFGHLFKDGKVAYWDPATMRKVVYVPRREVFEILRVKAPSDSWAWDHDQSRRLTQEMVVSCLWYMHVLMHFQYMPTAERARALYGIATHGTCRDMLLMRMYQASRKYKDNMFCHMVRKEMGRLSTLRTVRHVS